LTRSTKKYPASRTPKAERGSGDDLRPSAVVLAAGSSTRFGDDKVLARIGGRTILAMVVSSIPRKLVREVVVVVRSGRDAVATAGMAQGEVRIVANKRHQTGLASSIAAGITAVDSDSSGALIMLADQPFVTTRFLTRLISAYRRNGKDGNLVATASAGLVTPPAIFPRAYFGELLALSGDQGAKTVLEAHSDSLVLVSVPSKRLVADVDTMEDLDEARRLF